MDLTFAPASAQDIDAIYNFSKALIDGYEDLESIVYEKVLAWDSGTRKPSAPAAALWSEIRNRRNHEYYKAFLF